MKRKTLIPYAGKTRAIVNRKSVHDGACRILPQSADLHSGELTSLSKSADTHPNTANFGPIILPLMSLQPATFSAVETLNPPGHVKPSSVVLSCPHAGRIYPAEFIAQYCRYNGSPWIGRRCRSAYRRTLNHGVPCVTNKINRAYIDVNWPVDALDHLTLSNPPTNTR